MYKRVSDTFQNYYIDPLPWRFSNFYFWINSTNSLKLDSPSSSTKTVPLNQVLKGVIAYVEVKNSYDEDHSAGAKIVLKSMGAVVREKFTSDVTHVIFKVFTLTKFEMFCSFWCISGWLLPNLPKS